jgi:hypothetical protein
VGGSGAVEGVVGPRGTKVMLVFFLGGITYMEVAALRLLSKSAEFPYEIIVMTTKLINGNTFIKSVLQDVPNGLAQSQARSQRRRGSRN